MNFRTEIKALKSNIDINYQTSVFFMGSCFSNNIGEKIQGLKFNTVINPFGVLYNPLSISENLNLLINHTKINENDIFYDNNLWASFLFHSSFSEQDKEQFLLMANRQIEANSKELRDTNVLFITWGTSWVYKVKETGRIAANCHKIPASNFNRFLLEVDDITKAYDLLFQNLKRINPALKIVLTVSPIRHWKDGAVGNQVSKSILILAANKLSNRHNFVEYFPSYEIMMDDLRDYRFYDQDMLHPNKQAVDYIWEKFGETYFSFETSKIIEEISTILKAARHRPFNHGTESHQQFLKKTLLKIDNLREKNPQINLLREEEILKEHLITS